MKILKDEMKQERIRTYILPFKGRLQPSHFAVLWT